MKAIRFLLVAVIALGAVPLFAADRSVDVSGFVNWVDVTGDNQFTGAGDDPNFTLSLDNTSGWGAAVNVFWTNKISTEFAASKVRPEATFTSSDPAIPAFTGGRLDMIPITAILQYHFIPTGKFDPYVGAGAAYVLFNDIDNGNNLTLRGVDFKDDAGFAVNAGLGLHITPNLAAQFDAKYVPVSSSATAVFQTGPGQDTSIDVNPLIVSAGLQWQF